MAVADRVEPDVDHVEPELADGGVEKALLAAQLQVDHLQVDQLATQILHLKLVV